MKNNFKIGLTALAISLAILSGCKKEDPKKPAPQARVFIGHLASTAPGVDLFVDDIRINNSPLTYPDNIGYYSVVAGKRKIKVNAAGTTTSVINAELDFTAGKNYSIFAANNLAGGSTNPVQPVVVLDSIPGQKGGYAHVRFVHLVDVPVAVDIALDGAAVGSNVFSNVAFKQVTQFTEVKSGKLDLNARIAGSGNTVIDLPAMVFESGKAYTVIARGLVGGELQNQLNYSIVENRRD